MITYQDYKIQPNKALPMTYEIVFDGKGSVAQPLQGLFTSIGLAKQAIDNYLFGRTSKKQNAKAVSEG